MTVDTKVARPRRERVENAARRRAQIIEATTASIIRHGLAGTTLATVADEAGLSQGVMVFYFKTKQALLAETLRWHYEEYLAIWTTALERAGADPIDRVVALIRADFDCRICNPDMLLLWHAFWGESMARPLFALLTDEFDGTRSRAMIALCGELAAELPTDIWTPVQLAAAIDAQIYGLWQHMHLLPGSLTNESAERIALGLLAIVFPAHARRIMASID